MKRIDFETLRTNLKVMCHDCNSEISCTKGYDGIPIIQKGNHKLFFYIEHGWFACCKTTMQKFGKGSRKSKLSHPCRWEA